MERLFTAFLLATALLVESASADVLIVDAQHGPGWQYDDIPRAIHNAQPGDVVLVRSGVYHAFTIEKQLTVLGIGAPAVVDGTVTVRGTDRRVSLVALSPRELVIEDCTAVVTAQQMPALERVTVARCRDVRLHQLRVRAPRGPTSAALECVDARVEVFESELFGSDGCDGLACALVNAQAGGPALLARDESRVHLARTNAQGGAGAGGNGGLAFRAGDGGAAVCARQRSVVIVAGDGWTTLRGGDGGVNLGAPGSCAHDGSAGCVVDADASSTCRWSDVNLPGNPRRAGTACFAEVDAAHVCGTGAEPAKARAPTLAVTGWPLAGGQLVIELRGQPGSRARWWFGRKTALRPAPDGGIEFLARELFAFDLGLLPASGVLSFVFEVPTSYETGTFFVCQAELRAPGTREMARTNSLPIVVR